MDIVSGSTLSPLVQAARLGAALVAASYRKAFFFEPRLWILGLAGSVLLLVVLLVLGVPPLVLAAPVLMLAAVLAGLASRFVHLRPSALPVLALVSRLSPGTAEADGPSRNHQQALVEIVSRHRPELAEAVEPRKLEPLSRKQAERVIADCSARCVFYGEMRVSGDRWLATGGMLVDDPLPPEDGPSNRSIGAPPRHPMFHDPDRELRELVSDLSATHARVFEAEMLNLVVSLRA